MNCPRCTSPNTNERAKKTALGYRTFFCKECKRTFNERSGTPFNFLEYPTDIVLLVVFYRIRYKLSLRDLVEMFLIRGFHFSHETVREWEARFAPLITDMLRSKRKGKAGLSWYVDETYLKVERRWGYLYRCIDRDGNLVDVMLSRNRNMKAAKRFFKRAVEVIGHSQERVTSDGHHSYPCAVREVLGSDVAHRTSTYLNNRLEQDHRGIKQLYYPMRGFGNFESASRYCSPFEEVRQHFRSRSKMNQKVSLQDQRQMFIQKWNTLQSLTMAA